jgi:exopolysaccharide biosynthesis WecB/TagA/CpsF family protein
MIQATKQINTANWPPKYDLFGVGVSATNYDEAVDVTIAAAQRRESAVVSLHAVHAVVTASGDSDLREQVNTFQMVAPDGQPVRWALNRLYRTGLRDRVYGPEFMLRLCAQAAADGVSIYLYGGSPDVVETLKDNLLQKFPGLEIAGYESPPFRQLSADEDEEVVRRINDSAAGVVFIGLGCPKQDRFAFEHAGRIERVQVCVGAAFDFHAGEKKTPRLDATKQFGMAVPPLSGTRKTLETVSRHQQYFRGEICQIICLAAQQTI